MSTDRIGYWDKEHTQRSLLMDKDASQYSLIREPLFPENSEIADLGGGAGGDAMFFLEKGHIVTIYDVSQIALDFAKKRAKSLGLEDRLTTQKVDLENQPIPSDRDRFRVVYARLSLHYFTHKRTTEIFKEIERILQPGGEAYITLKSPNDSHEMDAIRGRAEEIEPNVFLDNGMLKSRFTISQLEETLNNSGIANFNVSEIKEQLIGKGQTARTGTDEFILNEVVIRK